MQKQILNYMNIFRGIAIIMIVLGHIVYVNDSIFGSICTEIFAGGTILFIFISGFLFQHLSYKFEYKNYLYKKFINVNSPYLITSIIGFIILIFYPNGNPFSGLSVALQIPILLSIGAVHNFSTWYIPVINIFFILSPILLYLESKKFAQKSILYLLLPLFFLGTIFCQRLAISNIDIANMNITYFSKYLIYLNFLLHNFVNIFFVYILGMYLSANKNLISKLFEYRKILIALLIITTIVDIYTRYKGLYSNGTLSKIFLTLIILAYLEHYDDIIQSRTKINSIFNTIAQYSFGIFFFHGYLLKLWYYVILKSLHIQKFLIDLSFVGITTYILQLVATFIFAFGGSFIICYFIKKILSFFNVKNTRAIIGA